APAQGGTSAPSPAASTSAAGAAASAALQQRVGQLESQLAESQRLLQLKNAELASLQAAKAAPAAPATTAPPPAATAPKAATPPPPAATPPAAEAPAAAPTAPPAAAPAASTGTSFLDLLMQYWYVVAGLVAVLVILLVVRAVRSRQEDAFDRSLGRLSQPGFESKPVIESRQSDTVPVRALPGRDEQSYRVEESAAHEQPAGLAAADTSASGRHVAIDENVPSEAPVALDQGDPLAEADFH